MYVMSYSKYNNMNLFQLKNKLRSLTDIIGREIVYLESYLKLSDIFETYLSTFIEYLKFSKLKKTNNFKNLF